MKKVGLFSQKFLFVFFESAKTKNSQRRLSLVDKTRQDEDSLQLQVETSKSLAPQKSGVGGKG